MMLSLTLTALTGFLATSVPAQPAWQTDYSKARALSVELKKPVAVFLAAGGSDKLVTGGIGDDAAKLLKDRYVCLSVDTATPAGRELAAAFRMAEGLVISDKTGGVQALRHDGAVTKDQLTGYLARFSTVSTVTTTENRSNVAPVGYPAVGGCPNGQCGLRAASFAYPGFGCANGGCATGNCANGQCGR